MNTMEALLEEYDLEIDDIRWHLSVRLAEEILSLHQTPRRLIEMIWSGTLGDRLFNMEDRLLEQLEADLHSGRTDEAKIREFLTQAKKAKRNRWVHSPRTRSPENYE
ncbi:hypothetical protein [Spirochaeta lutea]|uniref:hypothetical protein n=1 Tax=Spirochaeta lutea TaxID=1480694 RepID=UPI001EE6E6E8|nr:hypothetical protein [Spirochaeta lutea]